MHILVAGNTFSRMSSSAHVCVLCFQFYQFSTVEAECFYFHFAVM